MKMALCKTPISLLQEVLVKQKLSLPTYEESLSDKSQFTFKCTVRIGTVVAHGYASTKKEAKHKSAQEALIKLGVGSSTSFINNNNTTFNNNIVANSLPSHSSVNYIGLLNDQVSGNSVHYPIYSDCLPVNGMFYMECHFKKLTTHGCGTTKKMAKQESARLMWEKIKIEGIDYIKTSDSKLNVVDDNDILENVLRKYESLQVNRKISVSSQSEIQLSKVEMESDTMDELVTKLRSIGHACKVGVYQRDPYIMVLKIDNNSCVAMGTGKTKDDSMQHLLTTASIMFKQGYIFKNAFNL